MTQPTLSPLDFLPRPERSALLVVDVQERLVSVMPEAEIAQAVRNMVILIEAAKEFSLPLVLSEQYPKGLGHTVPEVQAGLPEGTTPIQKMAFSCCAEASFDPVWERWVQKDILLAGIEAHICVLQTALDLLARGQRVYVAADAVCSRSSHNKILALDMLRQAGAVIGSTEIFVFGMQRISGTERFKRISRLVK